MPAASETISLTELGKETIIKDVYEAPFVPKESNPVASLPQRIKDTLRGYYKEKDPGNPALQELERRKGEIHSSPELTAIAVLELLSSKPGKIRRTGSTFRNTGFDNETIETMVESIQRKEPITLFGLSFSPKFRNENLTGGQLMPDMGNYLAFENMQKVAHAAAQVYEPGLRYVVGFEGRLYKTLGRYKDTDIDATFDILMELNDKAKQSVNPDVIHNPVEIVDASELVQKCLLNPVEGEETSFEDGLRARKNEISEEYSKGLQSIEHYIEKRSGAVPEGVNETLNHLREEGTLFQVLSGIQREIQQKLQTGQEEATISVEDATSLRELLVKVSLVGELESWMAFYRGTTSESMFPNERVQDRYTHTMAFYYKAFNEMKYKGGESGKGILGFQENVIPFTVGGSKNKVTVQLVPGFDYYPHHRAIIYGVKKAKNGNESYQWEPIEYKKIYDSPDHVYIPKFVDGFDYPFYYEELKTIDDKSEDLNEKTSMGAGLRIMEDSKGNKFVVKAATIESGYQHLINQISRTKEMWEAGISIVPQVVDTNIKEERVYYVIPYLGAESADASLLSLEQQVFETRFRDMLSILSTEMWEKGTTKSSETYFTEHHLISVDRGLELCNSTNIEVVRALELQPTIDLNGTKVLPMSSLLTLVKRSGNLLDKEFSNAVIPQFTHGDLHFGNIFLSPEGHLSLIDINGTHERLESAIEFELSRLLLSFQRQIIRDNEYQIRNGENEAMVIEYTERGQQLLETRQLAIKAILDDPSLDSLIPDRKISLNRALLLEAIDIATVFDLRPEKQKLGTYLIGTELLNTVLKRSGLTDVASFTTILEKFTPETYLGLENNMEGDPVHEALLKERYPRYVVTHMNGEFVLTVRKESTA